jgi:uncharacterized MAPEG superfamily protein
VTRPLTKPCVVPLPLPLLYHHLANLPQTKAKIHRCEGAQTNGFENIGLFAAAVIAGNIAGLPAETLNTLSGGYILSRIVYNYIYITGTTETMASARTLAFFAGIGQLFALFIKSGNALRNRI